MKNFRERTLTGSQHKHGSIGALDNHIWLSKRAKQDFRTVKCSFLGSIARALPSISGHVRRFECSKIVTMIISIFIPTVPI